MIKKTKPILSDSDICSRMQLSKQFLPEQWRNGLVCLFKSFLKIFDQDVDGFFLPTDKWRVCVCVCFHSSHYNVFLLLVPDHGVFIFCLDAIMCLHLHFLAAMRGASYFLDFSVLFFITYVPALCICSPSCMSHGIVSSIQINKYNTLIFALALCLSQGC